MKAYLGITIHFIDEEWKQQAMVLSFKQLEGRHTGLALAGSLQEVLKEFGILQKVGGITLDNASNNGKMIQAMEIYFERKKYSWEAKMYHVQCLAHVINLAVQASLDNSGSQKKELETEADLEESCSSDSDKYDTGNSPCHIKDVIAKVQNFLFFAIFLTNP